MRESQTLSRGTNIRRACVTAMMVALGLAFVPTAHAQVPAIPAPVQDAALQVQDATFPVLVQVATAAQPGTNAVGFALRPACGASATSLVLVLALGQLPFSPAFTSTPVNLLCAGAFGIGPADPVFAMVDSAAGAQLQSAAAPVLEQAGAGLAPARPNLAQACTGLGLVMPAPYVLPPPLVRFDVTHEVCG